MQPQIAGESQAGIAARVAIACLVLGAGGCAASAVPALWTVQEGPCATDALEIARLPPCARVSIDYSKLGPSWPGKLRLGVPGPPGEGGEFLDAQQEPSTSTPDVWQGRLDTDPYSNVTISAFGSVVSAMITTSTGPAFRLRLYNGEYPVVERLGPPAAMGTPEIADRASCPEQPGKALTCGNPAKAGDRHTVKVLVGYSRRAGNWAGGDAAIRSWINLAAARTNQSFAQSGVRHRIELVCPEKLAVYEEAGSTDMDLARLTRGSHGLDAIQHRRDALGADVAILLVSNQDSPGFACTLPEEGVNTTRFAGSAYGVVSIQGLSDGDIFTHELGHILGAGHDGEGSSPKYSRAHAERATETCPAWQSIMVRTGESSLAPILYWSNVTEPFCSPTGKMGVADHADNARALNEAACTVAGYR